MRDLIEDIFVGSFDSELLNDLEDQAKIDLNVFLSRGDKLAFTTDSYVVDPLYFPGGNIGTLAVNGTVNDLAVGGAVPLYLTCSLIIEEGFSVKQLRDIIRSMKEAADKAGVKIVTGDTKVVERNAADKLFINTAGVGAIPSDVNISSRRAQAGDQILINGNIGDHGAAILGARSDLKLDNVIESDCAALGGLVAAMLSASKNIHCMRDATRGGVAGVLNEIAEASNVCVRIKETALPMREDVRGFCEILGLDPLYLANEGKLIAIVSEKDANEILFAMRQHELGKSAAIIGEISSKPEATVVMETIFGGQRMIDKLIGEQLPRIC